jgi:hypothetical protein
MSHYSFFHINNIKIEDLTNRFQRLNIDEEGDYIMEDLTNRFQKLNLDEEGDSIMEDLTNNFQKLNLKSNKDLTKTEVKTKTKRKYTKRDIKMVDTKVRKEKNKTSAFFRNVRNIQKIQKNNLKNDLKFELTNEEFNKDADLVDRFKNFFSLNGK